MIELPLVFLGGLLGSAHCIGMCGGFAVGIGLGSGSLAANLRRQLIYSAGRIFTYSFFGVAAGYAGYWMAGKSRMWINAQAALCVIAGLLLVGQGLLALGFVPRRFWSRGVGGGSPCLAGTFVGPFLSSRRSTDVLLAGIFTGFLPCGLVYGYLALASSSANVVEGMLTMSLFGAGTAPLMILAGTGGSLLSHAARGKLLRISAVCVTLTGLISVARGVLFMQFPGAPEVVRCVLCGSSGG
ncbi:MAG: sulfite exporter TauE/SafE family protein [Isosphaeraceae bacterium]